MPQKPFIAGVMDTWRADFSRDREVISYENSPTITRLGNTRGAIRTRDLRFRKALLYPAELPGHVRSLCNGETRRRYAQTRTCVTASDAEAMTTQSRVNTTRRFLFKRSTLLLAMVLGFLAMMATVMVGVYAPVKGRIVRSSAFGPWTIDVEMVLNCSRTVIDARGMNHSSIQVEELSAFEKWRLSAGGRSTQPAPKMFPVGFEARFGWPVHSMRWTFRPPASSNGRWAVSRGIPIAPPPFRLEYVGNDGASVEYSQVPARSIPYDILPKGFVISWAFWSVIGWIALALLGWIARLMLGRVREHYGHCFACGYDLHGISSERCPECGSSIRRRTNAAASA